MSRRVPCRLFCVCFVDFLSSSTSSVRLTFMWRHQQVHGLLLQVGPNPVELPLQVGVAQTLSQDAWGGTHKHVSANDALMSTAKPQGIVGVGVSPDASLMSRAVRIRAISVEVNWTVLSSAIGMFILTKRWEEREKKLRVNSFIPDYLELITFRLKNTSIQKFSMALSDYWRWWRSSAAVLVNRIMFPL